MEAQLQLKDHNRVLQAKRLKPQTARETLPAAILEERQLAL
jgi:hypothetical protein